MTELTDLTPERLQSEILAAYRMGCEAQQATLRHAIRCGELLTTLRAEITPAAWRTWLAEHWPGTDRHARRLMHLAARVKNAKTGSIGTDLRTCMSGPERNDESQSSGSSGWAEQAEEALLQIEAGDVGIEGALRILPRLPRVETDPAKASAAAEERARRAQIDERLKGSTIATRPQDLAKTYKLDVSRLDGLYRALSEGWDPPDLKTGLALAAIPAAARGSLQSLPVASRKRDLQELATCDAESIDGLVPILETGRADTLRGARKILAEDACATTTDRRGRWIPHSHRALLTELPDIVRVVEGHARALRTSLKRGRARLNALAMDGKLTPEHTGNDVRQMFAQGSIDEVASLISRLSYLMPAALCPACGAQRDEGAPTCATCAGQGWVSAGKLKSLEKERASAEAMV